MGPAQDGTNVLLRYSPEITEQEFDIPIVRTIELNRAAGLGQPTHFYTVVITDIRGFRPEGFRYQEVT